jgi:probable phosphomutase (TIGR03848 family)
VTTVLLVRHGLTALTGPILSGRRPGIPLDERGRAQAAALAARLRPLPLAAIVSSPLDRCAETAGVIAADRAPDGGETTVVHEPRLIEVDYGAWTGGEIRRLEREPLWRVVQASPSAVTFPDGESLRGMSARAVEAIRDWNARLGPDATWLACTHADIIRALLADALGLHLDGYGRLHVDPCSVSVVRYGTAGATVLRVNDTSGSAVDLAGGHGRRPGRPRRAKGVQSPPVVASDPTPPTEDR